MTWMGSWRERIGTAVAGKNLGRGVGAWVFAQLFVGLLSGIAAALLVVVAKWPLSVALFASCAVGLPLVVVFAWAAYRVIDLFAWAGRKLSRWPRIKEGIIGTGAVVGFFASAPAVLVVTIVALGGFITGSVVADVGTADPEVLMPAIQGVIGGMGKGTMPAWIFAASGAVLFGGLVVSATMWAGVVSFLRGGPWRAGVGEVLGIRFTRRVQLLAAVLGGFTMGWFPGWLANRLSESEAYMAQVQAFVPGAKAEGLPLLDSVLAADGVWGVWAVALVIAVIGPIAEEVVFRGFLWNVLEKWMPTWVVWLTTSALFALAHLDPVHTPTVLLIGLFLGWLRWTSGSLLPGVVAHVINNGLGVAVAWTGVSHTVGMPDATAWALGLMTLVVAACVSVARSGATADAPVEAPALAA